MSQSLSAAITTLQSDIAALTGIAGAPATPPAQAGNFPMTIAYEGQGIWEFKEMGAAHWGKLSIIVEIHFPINLWDAAFAILYQYNELIPKTIAKAMYNNSIGGNINNYQDIRTTGVVPMKMGDVSTIGQRWMVEGIVIKQDLNI